MTSSPSCNGQSPNAARTVDWSISRRSAVVLNAIGLLVTLAGLLGYGALAAVRHQTSSFVLAGPELLSGLLGMAAAFVVLLLLHEAIHGLAMLVFGARPSYGLGVAGGLLPYAYTTAAEHRFSRRGYLTVALAPSIVVTLATLALVGWGPYAGWLVLPAAIHLGGCVGDWWLVALAARQPAGSWFEDLRDGVRVHLP